MRFGKVDINNAEAYTGISKDEFSSKFSRFMRPDELEKAWEYVQKHKKNANRSNSARKSSAENAETESANVVAKVSKRRKRKKVSKDTEQPSARSEQGLEE